MKIIKNVIFVTAAASGGPSLFGPRGRCWAFIGLRFSAALQHPAPPPGTPAPHRCAGRIGARFPSCWQTSLYAIRVALPLAPCGTCRGCCPAIGNGPKIGPRSRGRLYLICSGFRERCGDGAEKGAEPRGQVGPARPGRVMRLCRVELSHGPPMRLHPRRGGKY